MKWRIGLFIIMIMVWVGLGLLLPLSNTELINLSFLTGLLFLILSASAIIYTTGFLAPVSQGFKFFAEKMVHKSRSMQRTDQLVEDDHHFQEFKTAATRCISDSTLIIGGSSVMVSVVGMFF